MERRSGVDASGGAAEPGDDGRDQVPTSHENQGNRVTWECASGLFFLKSPVFLQVMV